MALLAIAGPDALFLATPVELEGRNFHTVAEFDVREGERVPFVLTWYPSHHPPPERVDPEQALADTESFWQEWVTDCTHVGRFREPLVRSLVTLKALTYAPTGGIVAAATTSLPEALGGVRNWDYRYCWLRDATLTLLALVRAGYEDEARAWRDWLLRAIAGLPDQLQIMYGLGGERRLTELELEWLDGYEGSRPVRIGNAGIRPAPARRVRRGGRCALPLPRGRPRALARGVGARTGSCSSGSRRGGGSRIRGSGRCAAPAVTSPTRR